MELSERESDRVPVDPGPVRVGQRVELLGLLTGPEVAVEDEVRADDPGVVRADAAVGVQVVRVEEAPLGRTGGDLAAALVGVPVLEGEIEVVAARRPPVDPHDVVHLRVLGVLLRRVVELPLREVAVEVVGARQHVQQRPAVRVDALAGNDVAGEAARAGRPVAALHAPVALRISDDDELPPAVAASARSPPASRRRSASSSSAPGPGRLTSGASSE